MSMDSNRLAYNEELDVEYCVASEGRDEGGSYVPDIWHAVALIDGSPAELAACGANYDKGKLETDVKFESKPNFQQCGGCSSRVGPAMPGR
jgi:hypothetical protein